MRVIRLASLMLVLLLAGVWVWAWATRAPGQGLADAFAARLGGLVGAEMPVPAAGGGLALPAGLPLGGPFALTDQAGQTVTEADFAGGWMLIYFGYTYCPDVCPTELGTLAATIDALGEQGRHVTPVFITIDPERDTPAQLADYVSRFHPRLRGLTGTAEQVAATARRYRVYYARAKSNDSTDYLMDHSSFLYLVGPDGRVRSLYRPQLAPEAIAAAIASQLRAT